MLSCDCIEIVLKSLDLHEKAGTEETENIRNRMQLRLSFRLSLVHYRWLLLNEHAGLISTDPT